MRVTLKNSCFWQFFQKKKKMFQKQKNSSLISQIFSFQKNFIFVSETLSLSLQIKIFSFQKQKQFHFRFENTFVSQMFSK